MSEKKDFLEKLPVLSVHVDADYCLFSEAPLKTPEEAIELVTSKIYDSAVEKSYVIFLDESLCPICVACVGSGTATNTQFSIKTVIQIGVLTHASFIIMLHNHPGLGINHKQLEPSKEDVLVTDSMIKACRYVDIIVYDSIIAAGYRTNIFGMQVPVYYSMRKNSYKKLQKKYQLKEEIFPEKREDLKWEVQKEDVPGRDLQQDPLAETEGVEFFYGTAKHFSQEGDSMMVTRKMVDTKMQEALKEGSWYHLPKEQLDALLKMQKEDQS